jgi:hypothetical protein
LLTKSINQSIMLPCGPDARTAGAPGRTTPSVLKYKIF